MVFVPHTRVNGDHIVTATAMEEIEYIDHVVVSVNLYYVK